MRKSSKGYGEFSGASGEVSARQEARRALGVTGKQESQARSALGATGTKIQLVDYAGVTGFLRGRSATATADVVAAETGLPEARVQKWLDGANGMHADSFAALFAAYGIPFLRAACPWVGDLGAALDADRRQAELETKRAAIEREMREIRPW